ncbi:MAG: oligosaccharide flippase family protein [Bacteroidales bacterium]
MLFLFGNHLNILFQEPQLSKWLWIVPISSVSIVIFNTYNEWCVRNKYFTYLSYNKISNSSGIVLSKLFFGFYTIVGKGLLVGDILGRVFSAITCIYRALKKDKETLCKISWQKMKKMSTEFKDCPKFLLPAGLLDVLVMNMAVFMFSSFFTSSEVGYYSMAMAILSLPASVVAVAVKDVFRQRANEDYVNTGSCRPILKKTILYMGLGIIPVCLLLFFIFPSLFDFILGESWRMTGVYASILLPWVATDFVYSSISGVFIIANKMAMSLWLFILSFFASLIPLSIGCFYYHNIIISLSLMVIFRIFLNIYRTSLAYKYSQIK